MPCRVAGRPRPRRPRSAGCGGSTGTPSDGSSSESEPTSWTTGLNESVRHRRSTRSPGKPPAPLPTLVTDHQRGARGGRAARGGGRRPLLRRARAGTLRGLCRPAVTLLHTISAPPRTSRGAESAARLKRSRSIWAQATPRAPASTPPGDRSASTRSTSSQLANEALMRSAATTGTSCANSGDQQAAKRFKDARRALLKNPEDLTDPPGRDARAYGAPAAPPARLPAQGSRTRHPHPRPHGRRRHRCCLNVSVTPSPQPPQTFVRLGRDDPQTPRGILAAHPPRHQQRPRRSTQQQSTAHHPTRLRLSLRSSGACPCLPLHAGR